MQQGHEKVVAALLENDSRSKVKLSALHIAAKKDDVRAATLLLEVSVFGMKHFYFYYNTYFSLFRMNTVQI